MTWITLAAVDFDKWACATYKANFPEVDVRCSDVADALATLPDCDVLLGGPPCQGFSTAGDGKGEDDERNSWPDMIAAVDKKRPRAFLAENVPGMLHEKHMAYTRSVFADLERLGYVVETKLLDAVHYGVPQTRSRLWWWGIRKDVWDSGVRHKWPEPTHYYDHATHNCNPPSGLFASALLPAVTVGQALGIGVHALVQAARGMKKNQNGCGVRGDNPAYTVYGMATQGVVTEYHWSPEMLKKHPPASPASPVLAKFYKGGAEGLLSVDGRTRESRHPVAGAGDVAATGGARSPRDGGRCVEGVIRDGLLVRRLTPLELARLQSCPDDMLWPEKISKSAMYRVVGNGWACGIAAVLSRCMAASDPQLHTVVDLFCGGGLAALGWHQRYWRYESKPA